MDFAIRMHQSYYLQECQLLVWQEDSGHSSMNTTQKTYLHIIQELENRDIDLVMRSLSVLN